MLGFSRHSVLHLSASCLSAVILAAAIVPVLPASWGSFAPAPALASSSTQQAIARLKKSHQRWIEIDLSSQRMIAWEGKRWVDAKIISTGKASTPTPTGVFEIQSKYRSVTMRGQDYEVPNVPYAMFFYGNYAIHGAYWHNSFGTPVSHGCVNLAEDAARWLYNWADYGTPVVIHE